MPRTTSKKSASASTLEAKSGRLAMRVDLASKALLEEAATLEGVSVTAFVLRQAMLAAKEILEQHGRLVLNNRDSKRFLEMLDNPPSPSDALQRAARRHRELIRDSE